MTLATMSDAVQEYTFAVGADNRQSAWILSQYDTWTRNPFYRGPAVPHPEEYEFEDDNFPVTGWFVSYSEAAKYARAQAAADQATYKVFFDRGGFAAIRA